MELRRLQREEVFIGSDDAGNATETDDEVTEDVPEVKGHDDKATKQTKRKRQEEFQVTKTTKQIDEIRPAVLEDIRAIKEEAKELRYTANTPAEGIITIDKLRQMSKDLGLDFSEEEMQAMIMEADPTGRGQVDFKKIDNLFEETRVAVDGENKLMADIEEAFKLFDTGQTGKLRTRELAKALRIANMYPTKQDVRDILWKIGYPRTITEEQFKKITVEVSKTDNERLVAAFQCFDHENTGTLSEAKLRQILKPAICSDLTRNDMEQIICEFCVDGQVDLEILVAYISGQEQYLSNARKRFEQESSPEGLQTVPENTEDAT